MSPTKIKDNIVLNITLNILIITGLPYFVNPNYFTIDPEKLIATMAPIYGTATAFLVIFYVVLGEISLNKYALLIGYSVSLNLFFTCLFLLLLMHPFGFYDGFISMVTVLIIWNCYIFILFLVGILSLSFINYIKGKCMGPTKN